MNGYALLFAVVIVGGGVLGGVILCTAFGHEPRPWPRKSLSEDEESEIAIVASRFAALPSGEQAFAVADLMRWTALRDRGRGASVLDLLGYAIDAREAPAASSDTITDDEYEQPE